MVFFMTGGNEFNVDFFCLKYEINNADILYSLKQREN
jgi:hypothetical protein